MGRAGRRAGALLDSACRYHYPDVWQASYPAALLVCAAAPSAGAYVIAGALTGITLLLKRRERPLQTRFRALGESVVGWEEPFVPPAAGEGETIWTSFEIMPSPWGRLRWFFFRTDPPLIQADFADGQSHWLRLLREIAREPLPVTPLPRNLAEAAQYLRNQPLPARAEAVRLMFRTNGRDQYSPQIRVRWYAASR